MFFFLVGNAEHRGLPSFLFGQSMGGAVALKVHLKQPNEWNGAILVAPMCKVVISM
jgi:acylglycerol lipase